MESDNSLGNQSPTALPAVRRAPIEELIVYDVSEDELERLTQKTVDSGCLNLAIFLLTIFASYLSLLLTNPIQSSRTFVVYVVVTVVTVVAGLVLLCVWLKIWLKGRKTTSALVEKIKSRLPEADQETN